MANDDTQSYSAEQLLRMKAKGDYVPTRKDAPVAEIDEAFWQNARVVMPGNSPKQHTGIRLDADMLEWFKSQGRGWQSRMNAVLRSYYESHHNGQ